MSERRMTSDELIWLAAYAANQAFDERERTETEEERDRLTDDFFTLQAIVSVVMNRDKEHEAGHHVEDRLKMTIPELIDDLKVFSNIVVPCSDIMKKRLTNMLNREGRPSLCELLVMGYDRVENIYNLGKESLVILESVRRAVVPDIDWSPLLDGGYAAQFYLNLSEVPAKIIDNRLDGIQASSFNPDMPVSNSVEDLLIIDDVTLRRHLLLLKHAHDSPEQRTDWAITEEMAALRKQIRSFVTTFNKAVAQRA